ncbi:bifunctional 3-demethylubiquinone-9 3-methyltransferase/ 2-octaprenyl-6-hydroxy phenol methylase [Rubripirellula amarantea]|uniref:Bifunctional 3-demethylubiquinone-9 3-methyltransferase/ 2-octaprenyl-6-hydroxy phenol methylase n=1 Tax=Rubripirellula amarantea TaxID=2527999 RepID=A0A5C5WXM1_9BACT|nr:class I SAM-dependent methyltransferase [Rubripirellula amarantea]TWT54753.1 bifunctional 3-demethylubiquinone-9 3-methyltransferase/ 2-octaprenyl-6-hydroxy phenol methylase [Rubripirellula amarantea]
MQSNTPAPADAFAFGKNWSRFLQTLNDDRIQSAESSLKELVGRDDWSGLRFLDAGSGSGLFSLAAHRMGAIVTSFDVDDDSVGCTNEIKRRYAPESGQWRVHQGSLRDKPFMESLGTFDVVYCWGVAHHTGDMWTAIDHLTERVADQGTLVIAIYNDQLYVSRIWSGVKQIYQRLPVVLRPVFAALVGGLEFVKRLMVTLAACLLRLLMLRNPLVPIFNWIGDTKTRGMHGWYDLVDWVGGWPFEVAKPEEIFRFMRDRGFVLTEMTTACGGHGCNEFVFTRR